jgi:hypothetical protein
MPNPKFDGTKIAVSAKSVPKDIKHVESEFVSLRRQFFSPLRELNVDAAASHDYPLPVRRASGRKRTTF